MTKIVKRIKEGVKEKIKKQNLFRLTNQILQGRKWPK